MSIVGMWEVVSPGSNNPPETYTFTQAGSGYECAVLSANGSVISNIKVTGDWVELDNKISRPVPLTLHMVIQVDGDTFAGTVKARFIPERQIHGRRVA